MLSFGVADDQFHDGASEQLAFDVFGDAPLLAEEIDLDAMIGRRVVSRDNHGRRGCGQR